MPSLQLDTPTPLQDMTGQWWEPEELSPAIRDYLPAYTNTSPTNIVLLQPPANVVELAERISTFWMIYMCDKLSSVVAGFVCALPSESDAVDAVETVFPRMMDEYELGTVSDVGSSNLLLLFDHVPPTITPQRDSCWTVIIKGFGILERAIKLSAAYRARPTSNSAVALRQLELAANRFLSTLRPVAYFISGDVSTENMNSEDMAIFMAHHTVLGALMEIHQTLVDVDEKAYEARLCCAKSMAELTAAVTEGGLVYGCLIGVGFCWCLGAEVLIQHIESNDDKEVFVENYEAHLANIVSALEKLSLTFPMLVHQFKQVQEALGRIGGLSGIGVFAESSGESD
ncbi:hypothetical protein FRC01_005258 [Tulasnella sp. 417]|nr:hypothetical protein FRC01_005258 [Tulasnella sp. 417]